LEITIIAAGAFAANAWRRRYRETWNALLVWAAACSLLMFPFTLLFWNYLPKMRFMQFPWRWLLCLSLIFTILVTVGFRRWWMRAAVAVLSIAVILVGWHRAQVPWWDTAADLREMQDNMATGAGYEGTDEYTPVGADPGAIDKDARKVTVEGPAHAAIRVLRWDAKSKLLTAQMSAPDQLSLRLFAYPAWKVAVNGQVVTTSTRLGTGQMLVPVQAGTNEVEITFVRTWDRTVGGWISGLAGLSVLLWYWPARRRRRSLSF
jgi:FlaA1/EpsC-like NDP-sugar epimerase